jgi:bromodomain-containing protein 7/9
MVIDNLLLLFCNGFHFKVNNQEALLNLLKNCWHYATTVSEIRPILWAVLKQLGDKTPLTVLKALAEDDGNGKLKHAEIFRPLPPLLKRLVWEADWDHKIPLDKNHSIDNPSQYLKLVQSSLLYETANPLVEKYVGNTELVESASKFFVNSAHERRILTTQRRALASSTNAKSNTNTKSTSMSSTTSSYLQGKTSSTGTNVSSATESSQMSSGKAISQLRHLLSDTTSGTASYRPKLLHGILSMLIARHGSQSHSSVLTGVNLHCTLVADLLLSVGGPLPKIYHPVHTLARILDDAVKSGFFNERDLIKVQEALNQIYEAEHDENKEKEAEKKKKAETKEEIEMPKPTTFLKRQLNRIVTAGIMAMKETDPQSLFLNPVTDNIAPGYSKIIKKPMCISTMENKIDNNAYNSISDWESDVRLMFRNCVAYNRSSNGKWFRDEAGRQLKIFKDEICPQAKKLYMVEIQRRQKAGGDDDGVKRKRQEEDGMPKAEPLKPMNKKRKMDAEEYTLSMPAVASMLLADPFVVRLMLDHVLRSLRIDILKGKAAPVGHATIPSVMQLLHIAQWSSHICRMRGKVYLVPDSGLSTPKDGSYEEAFVPYTSMRRYLPVLVHLLIEADLDKRFKDEKDLQPVGQILSRPPPPTIENKEGTSYQATVALFEGAFVRICLPGNSQETSLAITFEKFAKALTALTLCVWEERAFFMSLVPAILRHKTRLKPVVRDAIISTWMEWLSTSNTGESKKKQKNGAMMSASHEYLILLLNEWSKMGNVLISRNLLLQLLPKAIETVNNTEEAPERKFSYLWKSEDSTNFEPIRKQYKRLVSNLPEPHGSEWLGKIGIGSEAGVKIEENSKAEKEDPKAEKEHLKAEKEDPNEDT